MKKKIVEILKKKAKSQEEKDEIDRLANKILDGSEDMESICISLKTVMPDIFKDKEFITELVSEEENLIKYDETNDSEVYIQVLQSKLNLLKEQKESNPNFISELDSLIQELKEPKDAPEGKYKVPKNILFSLIRESISDMSELKHVIYRFFDVDCKFSKEYCEKMEALYFDKENALIIHQIDNSTVMSLRQIEEIQNMIFTNGLRCYMSERPF